MAYFHREMHDLVHCVCLKSAATLEVSLNTCTVMERPFVVEGIVLKITLDLRTMNQVIVLDYSKKIIHQIIEYFPVLHMKQTNQS